MKFAWNRKPEYPGLPCVTKFFILRTHSGKEIVPMTRAVPRASPNATARPAKVVAPGSARLLDSVVEDARQAGLFDGDKTEHVSFRAPPALLEAAKREAGVSSTTELGLLALAMLARPDPVAAFFRQTDGRLGPDHDLEY